MAKRQRRGSSSAAQGHFSAADAAAGEETQNAHFSRGGGAEIAVSPAQEETTQAPTIAKTKRKANAAPAAPTRTSKRKPKPSATKVINDQLDKDLSYLKRPVAKQFDGRIRRGVVLRYHPPTRRWFIRYDGDSDEETEEMKWEDLKAAIELYDAAGDDLEAVTAVSSRPVQDDADTGSGRRQHGAATKAERAGAINTGAGRGGAAAEAAATNTGDAAAET